MCSVPGYDASGRVEDLAAELKVSIQSIAIGSICYLSNLGSYVRWIEWVGEWVFKWVFEWVFEWLVEWVFKWVFQWKFEQIFELVVEWL